MEKELQTSQPEHLMAGKRISLAEARNRVALFKKKYMERPPAEPEFIKANLFSKRLVLEVLHQPGCEGIRIYNSVNPAGRDPETGHIGEVRELILVGTDKNGNDFLTPADFPPPGKGCNILSNVVALRASTMQTQEAILIADPVPCPDLCGDKDGLGGDN